MKTNRIVIGVAILVAVLWFGLPFFLYFLFEQSVIASEERGQFGDMYGVLTSLFSGLTIVGLIYTIILQREDIGIARSALRKQNAELKLNREELRQTRKEFKQQNETMKLQGFENTFFKLIEIYQNNVRQFHIQYGLVSQITFSGKMAFEMLVKNEITEVKFRESLSSDTTGVPEQNLEMHIGGPFSLTNFYAKIYLQNESYLFSYFSTIEEVLQFIDNSNLIEEEKLRYISIFRSQLSPYEMVLIGFHILNRVIEHMPLKGLVRKYKLLYSYIWILNNSIFGNYYKEHLKDTFWDS